MLKIVYCESCKEKHFDHFACSKCGENFGYFLSSIPKNWKFCPVCGEALNKKLLNKTLDKSK